MKAMFICPSCGYIRNDNDGIGYEDLAQNKVVCKCGQEVSMDHSYPQLQAVDLIITSEQLYNMCKNIDIDNREEFMKFARKEGVDFSHKELMQYIAIMESVRTKYSDNEVEKFNFITDEFEKQVISKNNVDYDKIDFFIAAERLFLKNRYRKTFIIIVASAIEMLFNDFFNRLISKKLGDEGGKVFLSRYDHTGIKECIDICNSFVEKPLKEKMDEIKKGFFDKWGTLRGERNCIIHSNNKFISMKRTNEIFKLIDDSILVFSNLNSQLYSKK